MNNNEQKRCKVGELRPSQALTTFGIGSIIDLPNLSVMVMGLEDWSIKDTVEIGEQRLLASVKEVLGHQVRHCGRPPSCRTLSGQSVRRLGLGRHTGRPFPRWMVCPYCRRLAPLGSGTIQAGNAVSHGPDPVRSLQLHEARQAADRGAGPFHRGLQERTPGRFPLEGIRPSRTDELQGRHEAPGTFGDW